MPEPPPMVTAIVAAYNYERYLAAALDSALAQDYPLDRLEIIVVDDGSTDATPEIARAYARRHAGTVRYIRQDNAGLCCATNHAMREARGELITLLDADDTWPVSRTRLLVDALARNPRAGIAYGDMEVIDGEGRMLAPSWLTEAQQEPFRGRTVGQMLRSNFVIAPSLMMRARHLDRVCPIPRSFAAQDWYMAARVAQVSEIEFVPAVVARYRRHGANMGNHAGQAAWARRLRRAIPMRRWMLAHLRADELTIENFADAYGYFMQSLAFIAEQQSVTAESLVEIAPIHRRLSAHERRAGGSALAAGEHLAAAGHFAAALAADPFDPEAQAGLSCAQQRLTVPAARRAPSTPAGDYRIPPGYQCRELVADRIELVAAENRSADAVRRQAVAVATRLGATRFIDLGCGSGVQTAMLGRAAQIVGIDHGANLELARRRFSDGVWREHDLDAPGPLPLRDEEIDGAVLVCGGLLERLHRPEHLLGELAGLLPRLGAIVLGASERDLAHGSDHPGPPADVSHVREWNVHELSALLEAHGFAHGTLEVAQGDGAPTTVAVLFADAQTAARGVPAPVTAAA